MRSESCALERTAADQEEIKNQLMGQLPPASLPWRQEEIENQLMVLLPPASLPRRQEEIENQLMGLKLVRTMGQRNEEQNQVEHLHLPGQTISQKPWSPSKPSNTRLSKH